VKWQLGVVAEHSTTQNILGKRNQCSIKNWGMATHAYSMRNCAWAAWLIMKLLLLLVRQILTYCVLTLPFQPPIIKFILRIPCVIVVPPIVTWILPSPNLLAWNIDFAGTWESLSQEKRRERRLHGRFDWRHWYEASPAIVSTSPGGTSISTWEEFMT